MQKKPLALLEKIFYYFLVLNPLLDIASGIQLYLLNGGAGSMLSSLDLVNQPSVSPSFGVRMIILLCLALYVLLKKDWKTVALMASIGVVFAANHKQKVAKKSAAKGEDAPTEIVLPGMVTTEEVAAIAMAIRLAAGEDHDRESEILTIQTIKRAYSPWSSKIHGLTQLPTRK